MNKKHENLLVMIVFLLCAILFTLGFMWHDTMQMRNNLNYIKLSIQDGRLSCPETVNSRQP